MEGRMTGTRTEDRPIASRKWSLVIAVAALAGVVFGLPGSTRAAGPLGEWRGDFHDVAQARCHPNCKILGGGDAEGDDFDFTDSFPDNVLLDATKAHVDCSNVGGGNGCVFASNISVGVDNVSHKVYTHFRSRSTATKVRPVVDILQIK
jgi:hypothetical protein